MFGSHHLAAISFRNRAKSEKQLANWTDREPVRPSDRNKWPQIILMVIQYIYCYLFVDIITFFSLPHVYSLLKRQGEEPFLDFFCVITYCWALVCRVITTVFTLNGYLVIIKSFGMYSRSVHSCVFNSYDSTELYCPPELENILSVTVTQFFTVWEEFTGIRAALWWVSATLTLTTPPAKRPLQTRPVQNRKKTKNGLWPHCCLPHFHRHPASRK